MYSKEARELYFIGKAYTLKLMRKVYWETHTHTQNIFTQIRGIHFFFGFNHFTSCRGITWGKRILSHTTAATYVVNRWKKKE